MLFKLTRTYVYFILLIEILCLLGSILIYIALLTESMHPLLDQSKELVIAVFYLQIPAISLAKDRNIWENELKDCPLWLRITAIVGFVFVLAITLRQVMLTSDDNWPLNERFIVAAFLMLASIFGIAIVHSVLWSGSLTSSEQIKRVRASVVATALFAAVFAIPDALRAIHTNH